MVESPSLYWKIWPLIEKILSTEADEAGIDRYFFAKIASSGKRSDYWLMSID